MTPGTAEQLHGHDETRHARIVSREGIRAIAYIFSALAILLTSGRLVIRWRNTGRLWIDDYLNILAAILVVPFTVLCLLVFPSEYDAQLAFLGLGGKEPTIEEVEFTQRLTFVTLLLFWLIIYAVKGSFLALYWQIFAVSNRFRYVWWFTAGYTILSFCITWISIFWQCGSPSDLNNREACEAIEPSVAINLLVMWCTLHAIGGVLLMALPVFMVMTRLLTLEKSAKLGLVGIFSLVLIDIAFDIVRTTYSLSQYLSMHTNYTAIWTILEPTIAVIVCALPYYKILITRGKSRVRSDESSIGTRVTGASSRRRPHSTSIPLEMEFGSTRRLPSRRASQSSDSGP